MDQQFLRKAVIFGLIFHIIVVAIYITSRTTHEIAFMETYSSKLSNDRSYLPRGKFMPYYKYRKISYIAGRVANKSDIKTFDVDTDDVKINKTDKADRQGNESLTTDVSKKLYSQDEINHTILDYQSNQKQLMENETIDQHSQQSLSPSLSTSLIPPKEDELGKNIPEIEKPFKALRDEQHPLFDRAFAKNIKPSYLIGWKPSPESVQYFHKVIGADAYFYSAYLEKCTPPYVTLIGISQRNRTNMGTVFCHYHDSKKNLLETHLGSMRALKDNHQLMYTASAIDCPIPSDLLPSYVSVTKTNAYIKPNRFLAVQYHPDKPSRNFTLCFSPLHSLYNYTFQLVQSIELNRMLGASHFFFYNFSTSPNTDEILRYYQGQGLVTVLPWPLPHLESWYYGQITAINDCIYRNKMTSRYVVIVDTDEFIVPNYHSNWFDLLHDITTHSSLRDTIDHDRTNEGYKQCTVLKNEENDQQNAEKKNTKNAQRPFFGSFMFRCSFFADKFLRPEEEKFIKRNNLKPSRNQNEFFKTYEASPMLYLKRNDEIYKHESRSKLIIRPETVISHAIHKAVEHVAGYRTAYVNMSAAFLHHYRPYKIKSLNTLDTSALRFKDQFYERITDVISKFPSIFTKVVKAVAN